MAPQPIGSKKIPSTTSKRPGPVAKKAPIPQTRGVVPTKKPVTAVAQKKPLQPSVGNYHPPTTKKPLPRSSVPKPAPQQQSWLTRTTNAATAGVGNFAGAIVTAAGNGVAGAGKGAGASITNTSRGWGDAVREYGNSLKDFTGATGSRATTKSNPLGLSTSGVGARASMASRPGVTGSSVKSGTASNPLGL